MRTHTGLLLVLALVVAGGAAPAAASVPAAPANDHAAATTCAFPVNATDATGETVTVADEPERIVTLSPSAAQTAWEIGAKPKVVGVSQYASYLDGASERANVSGAGSDSVDVERVVALEPDLVLAPNTIHDETVAKLRRANLTVYRYRAAASLADIETQTRLTGRLTGECDGAAETAAEMNATLTRIRDAVADRDSPRVLYTFYGYTAGDGTFIDRIITTAGGTNVAAEAGISGYQEISDEVIVQRDPEWLVRNSEQPSVPKTDVYNATYAVRHDQVVVLDRDYISQPAPRVVRPIETLAHAIHPDAFANETTDATSGTAAETGTESETSATNETSSASGPGIGAVGAVGALLAALALARRWE